jgi:hypothetical protein
MTGYSKRLAILAGVLAAMPALADGVIADAREVDALLRGKTLEGVYLRTASPYRLVFGKDGKLINQDGSEGRWWIDDQARYCREWTTGALQGNKACLGVARAPKGIAILHGDKVVAEGTLSE